MNLTIQQLNKELERIEREIKKEEQEQMMLDMMREYTGEDELISSIEAKKIFSEKISKWYVSSQFPSLEKIIGGFQEGNLIIVTAPTKQGKTTFCQTLTSHFAEKGTKCLWFSYEVPIMEFLLKFNPNKFPIFYLPKTLYYNTEGNLLWLERKIIEGIAKYQTKVVFIDHLHYLLNIKNLQGNVSLMIGGIMRELKKIALKYKIVIFLITHMTKTKFEEKPGIEDIRDSSFISQEADFVIVLWREREKQSLKDLREKGILYTNKALVSVEANRRTGSTGTFRVMMKDNLFYELTSENANYDEFINQSIDSRIQENLPSIDDSSF